MVEVTLKRLVQFAPDTITQIVIPEPTLCDGNKVTQTGHGRARDHAMLGPDA